MRFVEATMFPASYLNTVAGMWLENGHILAYCQRKGTLHQRSEKSKEKYNDIGILIKCHPLPHNLKPHLLN